MILDPAQSAQEIDFIVGWQSIASDHAAAITAFWLRETALDDAAQAQARLPEVVLHAQDQAGTVVAVCTAVGNIVQRLGQPMYYYRAYVAAPWRKHGIALNMLQRASQCLDEYARARDFPCIGVVLELQSPELHEMGKQPFWPRTRFNYIGESVNGYKLFVHYFEGAKFKP